MACLYCGKEIGTLRVLRDSEFCCIAHRNYYGARLNRALHEMAAPELAPAPEAGYFVRWPAQEAEALPHLDRWEFGSGHAPLLQKFAVAAALEADGSEAQGVMDAE